MIQNILADFVRLGLKTKQNNTFLSANKPKKKKKFKTVCHWWSPLETSKVRKSLKFTGFVLLAMGLNGSSCRPEIKGPGLESLTPSSTFQSNHQSVKLPLLVNISSLIR